MKQKIKFLVLFLLFSNCITFLPVNASNSSDIPKIMSNPSQEKIDTYTDKLEWRYKMINGSLYKRLYNSSKNRWETDWILVE